MTEQRTPTDPIATAEPPAPSGLRRGFESLGIRNYRLYWSGQVVSLVGTWMQQVSLPWLVLALGGTPIQLGIVAALEFIPATVLAPFGGVIADRLDKRRALIWTQVGAAAQAFALFVLVATGVVEIWMVMVMGLWRGLLNAVEMPTRQALAADLVPRPLLANAIALNSMAFNAARVVGPAIAGLTIAIGTAVAGSVLAGVAVNLAINAVSFAAVLVALLRMDPSQIRRPSLPVTHPPVLHSLAEGVVFAVRTPLVFWCLLLLGGIATFGFNFQILLPLFATDVLGLGAEGYGGLYAVLGIGSLAGSLTLAFMRRRRSLPLILVGGAVFSLLVTGIALAPDVLVAGALIGAAGFASMLTINTINAAVQANVTDALRGRVMSFYVTVFAASVPIGSLFAGAMAEAWGTPAAFAAGGALSLLTVGVVTLGLRAAAGRGSLGRLTVGGTGTGSAEPSVSSAPRSP